ASWCAAHEQYGRLSLARDLAAAIGYAREGYPVTGRLARWIEMCAGENALNAHALALFVPCGAAPRAGDKLVTRGLALPLEATADAPPLGAGAYRSSAWSPNPTPASAGASSAPRARCPGTWFPPTAPSPATRCSSARWTPKAMPPP